MIIKHIDKKHLEPFIKEAKANGLVFCKNTTYYGLYINDVLVSFAGILWYKNKAVLKNDYTLKEYRGKSYHKELLEYRIMLVKNNGISIIEATCTQMSLKNYANRGFKLWKQFKLFKMMRLVMTKATKND